MGNYGLLDGSDNTGEPFIIGFLNADGENLGMLVALDGSELVSLSITGDIIHKIEDKWLPTMPVYSGINSGSVRTIGASLESSEY